MPSFGDAVKLRSPSWVGQPDDDGDEDEIARAASRASAIGTTLWFLLTSGVMLSMLVLSGRGPLGFWSTGALPSGWDAPWWLTAIFACEAYASFRRLFLKWKLGRSNIDLLGQRKLSELEATAVLDDATEEGAAPPAAKAAAAAAPGTASGPARSRSALGDDGRSSALLEVRSFLDAFRALPMAEMAEEERAAAVRTLAEQKLKASANPIVQALCSR